jgi:hypothetical protein
MRALVMVVFFALLPGLAFADKDKAQQYFRAGAEAYKRQSFGAAADSFELAYKELALPEIAFSAAQAYRRQYYIEPKPEYVKRAVELYRAYLDHVRSGGRVGDASDGLAEMQRELDRLTAAGKMFEAQKKPQTRLAISAVVRGEKAADLTELSALPSATLSAATATLDGTPAELFTPVEVAPGDHTVQIEAPGYVSQKITRHVVEGSTELVEATLEPKPAKLAVRTAEGAHISIDGKPADATTELAAGHHVVVITARGREPVLRELDLGRGKDTTLDVPLDKTAKRRSVPWVLGGSGLFAAGCVTTALIARSHDDQMQKLESKRETMGISAAELAQYHHEASQRDAYRDGAYVLGGAAIAAGAVAAALYWFDTPHADEHVIVPTASAAGGGVSVIGRF